MIPKFFAAKVFSRDFDDQKRVVQDDSSTKTFGEDLMSRRSS